MVGRGPPPTLPTVQRRSIKRRAIRETQERLRRAEAEAEAARAAEVSRVTGELGARHEAALEEARKAEREAAEARHAAALRRAEASRRQEASQQVGGGARRTQALEQRAAGGSGCSEVPAFAACLCSGKGVANGGWCE